MNKNPCFTILWKIENFPYCPNIFDECLKSPEFNVTSLNKSTWELHIFPSCDNEVKVQLHNSSYLKNKTLTIDYEIAFLSSDDSVLHSGTVRNKEICVGNSYEISNYPSFTNVFENKRNEFLPKNTLTIRCQIKKKSMKNSIQFFACTRIGILKRSFHWAVTEFSKLKSNGKKKCRRINVGDEQTFLIELFLKEAFADQESVGIDIKQLNMNIPKLCSTWKISVLDATGDIMKSKDDTIWFSPGDDAESFPSFFTKNELVSMETECLVGDTLNLLFDVTFSTGVVSSNIESVSSLPSWIQRMPESYNAEAVLYESSDESVCILQTHLLSLYEDKTLSDFELRSGITSFPVHKSVLSARSPVFKAMYLSDMKEGTADFLDIPDVNPLILEKMLMYIYTGSVSILDCKTACNLYYATDKYEILSLKQKCSSFLASNIADSNVCEILALADRHKDECLKSSVYDFIVLNDCKTIASIEWKQFLINNPLLAAETMQLVYSRKLDLHSII